MSRALYLVDGARTPFGTYMGELRHLSAADLAIAATREALSRARVAPDAFDAVVLGNVMQAERESYYLAKYVGLQVGMAETITGLTVNRLCGSGMQAVVSACQAMRLEESELALVGGTECMSRAPFILRGAREGLRGDQTLEDPLLGPHSVFVDPACGLIMGETAEVLGDEYGISREAMDTFALRSQEAARQAIERGRLAREIVPVEIPGKGGPKLVSRDEHPRETSLEKLATLKPAFRKGGHVTPGNASGINDGACSLVLATEERVAALNLTPKARVVSWSVAGVSGRRMGIGPAPAIQVALQRAGLTLADMSVIEVNEAFAAQYLAVEKELGLDRDKVNPNGGAIALGHPIGASGARILLSLMYELEERQARYGVASACIGGGQGIAMVLERVS
ncbi:MAG: thiolase family protein [Candidatus Sericytochromatia bacterium]|nr:thiolase family protein [Candidatus Sericytochromatia bacterium]